MSVRDTGIGIDPVVQNSLFNPFIQAERTAEEYAVLSARTSLRGLSRRNRHAALRHRSGVKRREFSSGALDERGLRSRASNCVARGREASPI